MKKRVRILCLVMVMLLTMSVVGVVNSSAAQKLANSIEFEATATFNSIEITPPEKAGNYIYYLTYDEQSGKEMEEYIAGCEVGGLTMSYLGADYLFTEPASEIVATNGEYDADGFPVLVDICGNSKYYLLVFEVEINDDIAQVIAYGDKWITTPETPDEYKGYEGYLKNTVDFEVIPGTNTITLEPIDDGKEYVVEVVKANEDFTVKDYEELLGNFPTGYLEGDGLLPIETELIVGSVIDFEGNPWEIVPGQDYIVCYYMLDANKKVITYGMKGITTPESLDIYENDDAYVFIMDGDANMDLEINIKDATAVQKHIAKSKVIFDERALICADGTGDGEVNIKDATLIQKYVAKAIPDNYLGTMAPVKK